MIVPLAPVSVRIAPVGVNRGVAESGAMGSRQPHAAITVTAIATRAMREAGAPRKKEATGTSRRVGIVAAVMGGAESRPCRGGK